MPSNCHKYRIFCGLSGNIKFTSNLTGYSWPDMWASVLLCPPSSLGVFDRDFGPGARQVSPPLFPRSDTLRPRAFAVYPSPSCPTNVESCAVVRGLRRSGFASKPSPGQARPIVLRFVPASRRLRTEVEGGSPNIAFGSVHPPWSDL